MSDMNFNWTDLPDDIKRSIFGWNRPFNRHKNLLKKKKLIKHADGKFSSLSTFDLIASGQLKGDLRPSSSFPGLIGVPNGILIIDDEDFYLN